MNRLIVTCSVVAAVFSFCLVWQVGSAAIQDKSEKAGDNKPELSKPADKSQKAKAKEFSITPEREAAALTFVQQHHPELTRLLEHLKTKSPSEYSRAMRDLFQVSERLAKVRERDVQRYELELQAWQAKSRCELLAARLQVKESPKMREQLREALTEKEELQIKLLEWERDRLAERLQTLETTIESRVAAKQESVEQGLKQVAKSALDRKKKREAVKVPADKEKNPTKEILTQE